MGCIATQEDPSNRTPLEVIQAVFEAWGSGQYAGPDGAKLIARDWDLGCKVDATASGITNTDMYKVYNGHEGITAWLEFLTGFDFPDFKLDEMKADESNENQVLCKASYTPTVKATMKLSDKKMADSQTWTVKDGKVQEVKFTWGDEAALNALFAITDAEKTVAGIVGAWGQGKFSGDGAKEAAESMVTADCVTDATGGYEFKNTEGYKNYEGIDGFLEWIKFLEGLDFPDFKVVDLRQQEDGTVKMLMSSTTGVKATGKSLDGPITNEANWTIADGKISKGVFTWNEADKLDALFV